MTGQILATGFDLGGNPAVRQLQAEGIVVSARPVLRLLRAAPLPVVGAVRMLGVDDWSKRKGRTFGTILVNLETHTVTDLLPDRTADTLAAWLRGHPEVEVVSRDRAGAYAGGVRQGAPQATKVADRFHLERNLTDALARYLQRKHAALRQASQPAPPASTRAASAPERASAQATAKQQGHRAARLAREHAPHVVVCDPRTIGGDGAEAVRRLRREVPYVVVLTSSLLADEAAALAEPGSAVLLFKGGDFPTLLEVITALAAHQQARMLQMPHQRRPPEQFAPPPPSGALPHPTPL